jgi:hypothetical protein
MLSAGRSSGSKIVAIAVAGTIGVAGIGTFYLPFIADRDQMRGMDEAGGMDKKQRREMEQYLKNEGLGQQQEAAKGPKPGSMWSNMKK